MSCCRCSLVTCTFHSKLLDYILCIFTLRDENSIFHLLDLKTKEISKFTHKAHLKFRLHLLYKMLDHLIRHSTKKNIIHIDLCYHQSSVLFLQKQGFAISSFPVAL